MEYPIAISNLNDFIFCPVSIYFHGMYMDTDKMLYQSDKQINGTFAHEKVDEKKYSTSKHVLQSIDVYCEKYGLIGKIDTFDASKGVLTERKKHINKVYDGYVFQLYAQYFCLTEMGYSVKNIRLYSYDDNKVYDVDLPEQNPEMLGKFEKLISDMQEFDITSFFPTNEEKCKNCIYSNLCDRGL